MNKHLLFKTLLFFIIELKYALPCLFFLHKFQDTMNNFEICYNALCAAFNKENVIIPDTLVKILKPDDAVDLCINLLNTAAIDSESDATTNNESNSSDESDESSKIDLNKTFKLNITNNKKVDTVRYVSVLSLNISKSKSITRSFSTLTLTTGTNSVNLSSSSSTVATNINPLDLPRDRKCRQETFNQLRQLIFEIRQQKRKTTKKEVYDLPPLIKQIVRCLYPSDIDEKIYSQKPDVTFTLQAFIELFRT
uniref:Uncharacterized protein n=1 Tax=Adineta vaga TaxID=104782 RepID=B3G445_ADIVA|nr:unknown [Adineta vaga]